KKISIRKTTLISAMVPSRWRGGRGRDRRSMSPRNRYRKACSVANAFKSAHQCLRGDAVAHHEHGLCGTCILKALQLRQSFLVGGGQAVCLPPVGCKGDGEVGRLNCRVCRCGDRRDLHFGKSRERGGQHEKEQEQKDDVDERRKRKRPPPTDGKINAHGRSPRWPPL